LDQNSEPTTMTSTPWTKEFPGGVTVCDANGIVLEMNDRAAKIFEKDGGQELVGKSLFNCHPEPARTKLREMLASGESNAYTIEKAGVKKLIYQAPWHENGEFRGFVELSLVLPNELPHFIRKG
jgi:transcriptional regulator with PAS, ATPase and Fis domain